MRSPAATREPPPSVAYNALDHGPIEADRLRKRCGGLRTVKHQSRGVSTATPSAVSLLGLPIFGNSTTPGPYPLPNLAGKSGQRRGQRVRPSKSCFSHATPLAAAHSKSPGYLKISWIASSLISDMDADAGLNAIAAQAQQAQQGLETGPISLSAQAELELELSLRGSLLVQQQRRIVQLEDELQRAWAEIERLRTKLGSLERDRQPARRGWFAPAALLDT